MSVWRLLEMARKERRCSKNMQTCPMSSSWSVRSSDHQQMVGLAAQTQLTHMCLLCLPSNFGQLDTWQDLASRQVFC